jgi:hypothetical protein
VVVVVAGGIERASAVQFIAIDLEMLDEVALALT